MEDRSNELTPTSSTAIRKKFVRKSLANIKQNNVAGLVKSFSQEKDESIDDNPSKLNSIDSGYDSINYRQRASTCLTSSINEKKVIESYAKYPNFKWSYFKYFGEDAKTYFARYGIDFDAISNNSTGTNITNRNRDANVNTGDLTFDSMRNRSQSCNAKTDVNKPNLKVRFLENEPLEMVKSQDATIKDTFAVKRLSSKNPSVSPKPIKRKRVHELDTNVGKFRHCVYIKTVGPLANV